MSCRLVLAVTAAAVLSPAVARAQAIDAGRPAAPPYVARINGGVTLEHEGRAETSPLNMPVVNGDRVRTTDGRAEIRFSDGQTVYIDAGTTFDLQSEDLSRLMDGRVRVSIPRAVRTTPYRVDSPAGSVRISEAGEYRLTLVHGTDDTQLELAVVRGTADIFTDEGETTVHAGERAYASTGLAPSYPYVFNSAASDDIDFDRWIDEANEVHPGASTQYLPADMTAYSSTFDEYGDWQYQQPYGYVWYPRVTAGWRPYYYGRWMSYRHYGWTWVGADRFAWPTHHFGRWGFSSGLWFWIPASRWAPAYVSWAYAPNYVSWCPLGWDNRAVSSLGSFNASSGYYSSAPGYYSAWTVVSRPSFGRGFVHERAVSWDRIDRTQLTAFQQGAAAPARSSRSAAGSAANVQQDTISHDYAVPRGTALPQQPVSPSRQDGRITTPIREPQPAAPRYVNRGDEIIRSQTTRPEAARRQSPAPMQPAPDAVMRTQPERRVERPAAGYTMPAHDVARPRGYAVPQTSDPRVYQPHYEPRYEPPPTRMAPAMRTTPPPPQGAAAAAPVQRAVPSDHAAAPAQHPVPSIQGAMPTQNPGPPSRGAGPAQHGPPPSQGAAPAQNNPPSSQGGAHAASAPPPRHGRGGL